MADRGTAFLERRMGDWARARLHPHLAEFIMFVLKQGWAALFGILFLGAIILTKLIHELRRIGGRYGLATMCIGGGQGIAVVIENA